ncbi:general transcription factor IIF subunit 2 isoform X1 [Hydra vulgaris]|uniref:general transcription factor IIF subunit 2 isoform X1 n=1 Tax=Hydra vulgaris TaxID=6087 RepID=UPI001F5EC74E|nr:general transcription factor IIF subunit 2 [Hydra vulgaris]
MTSSPSAATSSLSSSTKVDCTRAGQSVWLVKVPKYIADIWGKADASGIVGSLKIPKHTAPKHMLFELSDHLVKSQAQGIEIPSKHKFEMSDIWQTFGVFSETPCDDEDANEQAREKIAFEGKIIKRADCRPIEDPNYMQMKRKAIEKACRPVRQVKQITGLVTTFKPVNDHQINMEPIKKRKEEGKRVRAERDEVLEVLFSAFEKHQFYTLKDLVGITQQPVVHLKAILRDVCNYNLKNPHKNTYELKPEYRHYKKDESETELAS